MCRALGALRLGVERRRQFCAGDVETPILVEKLLSRKRDQGDRELDASLGAVALVACQDVLGRDMVAEKRYF